MHKKGVVELGVIVLVVVVLIFLGWWINVGSRECTGNNDCGSDQYCGSDFSCHDIPIIEKQASVNKVSLLGPAWILGLAGIVVALIFRWERLFPKKPKQVEEKSEQKVYYKGAEDVKKNF